MGVSLDDQHHHSGLTPDQPTRAGAAPTDAASGSAASSSRSSLLAADGEASLARALGSGLDGSGDDDDASAGTGLAPNLLHGGMGMDTGGLTGLPGIGDDGQSGLMGGIGIGGGIGGGFTLADDGPGGAGGSGGERDGADSASLNVSLSFLDQ